MDKTPAEQLQLALAILEVISDNAGYHSEGCGVCAAGFRCQTAAFWHQQAMSAADDVERYQQELRRAALATR